MLLTGWILKTPTFPSCSVSIIVCVYIDFADNFKLPELPVFRWSPPPTERCQNHFMKATETWRLLWIIHFSLTKAYSAGWESWKNGFNHMLTSSSGEKKDLIDSCDQLQASPEKTASSPTFLGADCWINSESNLFYQPGLSVEHLLT